MKLALEIMLCLICVPASLWVFGLIWVGAEEHHGNLHELQVARMLAEVPPEIVDDEPCWKSSPIRKGISLEPRACTFPDCNCFKERS